MADHDGGYKNLFSQQKMIRDLLIGFVHAAWVQHLDFNTLEKINVRTIGDDLRQREGDLLWRVRLDKYWLHILLILELQASVDEAMPERMVDYAVSSYRDLRKSGVIKGTVLPPVVPIVLYRGSSPWNVPLDIGDCIPKVPGLEPYQPRMRYILLDINTMIESDVLDTRNLAAALIAMEKSRSPERLRHLIRMLEQWLRKPEDASVRRAFSTWLRRVLLPTRLPGITLPELTDLNEEQDMLDEMVQIWSKELHEDGRRKGKQEGQQEEAKAFLLRLLNRRFGPLPGWITEKIHLAKLPTLEAWGDRMLEAATLEEIFFGDL
ncbi:MAG: Rpn family recombination-promoting nuclease/putative transposase [Magnetococcales bacterium]|nr:Rpn family recombination-promoting nuclease/putative transposase [Magnetococcales bacterium]